MAETVTFVFGGHNPFGRVRAPGGDVNSLSGSTRRGCQRCCLECGGKCRDGVAGGSRLTDQAARSMTASVGLVASVCQPSTLRMVICPDASSAQNNIAAVSGDGRTVWVLMRRLNSSCSRSTALVVRAERHWPG